MNSITFGVQGMTYRRLEPGPGALFLSGGIAGVAQSIVVSPVELVKTQMQLQGQGMKYKHVILHTPDEHLKFSGSWDCIKKIYSSGGLKGVYRGFVATAAREAPGMGLYFSVYHELCSRMAQSQGNVDNLGVVYLLFAGGVTGCISWFLTYPIDVIKSRFQADINGKYVGLLDCIRHTYTSQGLPVFFRGLSTALVRAFPVNAAILATVSVILRNVNGGDI